MTPYEAWNNSYGFIRSDLINLTKAAFDAGAASRDAEIEGYKGRFDKDQDRIACQAEQLAQKDAEIAELVAALKEIKLLSPTLADAQVAALEALAKVRKP